MTPVEAAAQPRATASDTLLRLVRFAAAACDARYAFVAAFGAPAVSSEPRSVHFWVARDYGLRTERMFLALAADQGAPWRPVDCVLALRQIWPEEAELAGLTLAAGCVTLPLLDDRGRLLGHMGILDPGRACLYAGDRLPPLGRLAAAQLAVWTPPPSSPEKLGSV